MLADALGYPLQLKNPSFIHKLVTLLKDCYVDGTLFSENGEMKTR
jgi:hypothetical protein